GRAYTLAPLTFLHRLLGQQVERLKIGLIEDGTAIGDGLRVALTRLELAERQSGDRRQGAFVVLQADGATDRVALSPAQPAEIVKNRGIPVYTTGAGRNGLVPVPVEDPRTGRVITYRQTISDLDEPALRQIAAETGGRYFRADDHSTVESAFRSIDESEKIEFQAQSYLTADELFPGFAGAGAAALLLAALAARNRHGTAAYA